MAKHSGKHVPVFLIAIALLCSGCGKQIQTTSLFEYFQHYPIIKETNRIDFTEEDFHAIAVEGWARAASKPEQLHLLTSDYDSSLRLFIYEQGKLPNLQKLIESGVSGPLRSVKPMYSPVI
jgi:hypothetical protein